MSAVLHSSVTPARGTLCYTITCCAATLHMHTTVLSETVDHLLEGAIAQHSTANIGERIHYRRYGCIFCSATFYSTPLLEAQGTERLQIQFQGQTALSTSECYSLFKISKKLGSPLRLFTDDRHCNIQQRRKKHGDINRDG